MSKVTRSFRLDSKSVREFLDNWPTIVIAACICGWLLYNGWFDSAWWISLVVFAAIYVVSILRGNFMQRLRARYPNARFVGLLALGLVAATVGIIARMVFPEVQGGPVDFAWISISFVCILSFVLFNRHDSDVVN